MRRWQSYIPKSIRLARALSKRNSRDKASGIKSKFANSKPLRLEFEHKVSCTQPIKRSSYFENKIHNIRLSGDRVSSVMIKPGEVFSFWEAVGSPSKKGGFKEGRNIVDGKLQRGYGGGLCQLSGIIYYLVLQLGFPVLERHNHSVDIYNEETRFAPLGSDATVVYGYKDLRFENNFDQLFRFEFDVNQERIVAIIRSDKEFCSSELSFQLIEEDGVKLVKVLNSSGLSLNESVYGIPKPSNL